MVFGFRMAKTGTGAHFWQYIRRIGHALHATGNAYCYRTCINGIGHLHDGFHARAAHLIDGGAGGCVGQARFQGGLARWRLALSGG